MAAAPILLAQHSRPEQVVSFENSYREAVVKLWSEIFSNGSEATFNRDIDVSFERNPDLFRLALYNGNLIGTCLGASDGHRSWIYYLCVRCDMRRRGIATQLLHKVEGLLRDQGATQIGLHVLMQRPSAIKFYRARGYLIEEAHCMGKNVT